MVLFISSTFFQKESYIKDFSEMFTLTIVRCQRVYLSIVHLIEISAYCMETAVYINFILTVVQLNNILLFSLYGCLPGLHLFVIVA